jgi:putative restriction endonuclease
MILSLDLYFRTPYNKRTRNNPEIIELAKLIGRTPASVVLRMANYLCFDIEEQKLGHKGMDGGTRQCKPFWEKYVDNRELLHKQAMEIKLSKQHSEKK